MLDVGCGTGRVTEALLELVPRGRILAMDASADMVALARRRLGDRAELWCQDALDLDLDEPVDAILSTATLHWVTDHDRLWARLARALRPGGMLEVQCGGEGNIKGVREVIDEVARDSVPNSSAGRRGSSQGLGIQSGACGRLGSLRRDVGLRSARPIRRTWPRSCPRRYSPRTLRGCPRRAARRSPPPSSRESVYRWTTCASTSPPCAARPEARCWRTDGCFSMNASVLVNGTMTAEKDDTGGRRRRGRHHACLAPRRRACAGPTMWSGQPLHVRNSGRKT